MKLARVKTRERVALAGVLDGTFVDLTRYLRDAGQGSVLDEALDEVERDEEALAVAVHREQFSRAFAELAKLDPSDVEKYVLQHVERVLPPVRRPGKIIGLGRNYFPRGSSGEVPPEVPFFCKATTSLVGPEDPIRLPPWIGRVDPEGELAVVIGRPGRYISEEEALNHIAGYSIANDVSARELQGKDMERKDPWFRAKSIDTFFPLGPWLVTPDEVPDPHALPLKTVVNGEVVQESSTGQLVFGVPKILAFLSSFMTLEPGDVIATGTPEGTRPLSPGDVVEISIGALGTLRNPVMRE